VKNEWGTKVSFDEASIAAAVFKKKERHGIKQCWTVKKIEFVAPAVIKLYLSENKVSQSISQAISQSVENSFE